MAHVLQTCVVFSQVQFVIYGKKKKPFSSFFNSMKALIFHLGYIYSYYSSIEHAKDSALEILR